MAVYERVSIGSLAQGAVPPGYTFTRSTAATYIDSDGLLKSAAINTPRRQWDATNRRWGYVGEGSRTNLILQSGSLNTSPWAGGLVTVSETAYTSPDGSANGSSLTVNSTGSSRARTQTVTLSATVHSISMWVRAGTVSSVNIGLYNAGFVGLTASILSGAGSLSGSSIITVSGLTSEWTLVSLVTTAAVSAASHDLFIYPKTSATQSAGDSIGVWGVQLEAAPAPSSYIPTTTVAVTRGADLLTRALTGPEGTALSTQGTMVVEFSYLGGGSAVSVANRYPISIDDGSTSERIAIYNKSGGNTLFIADGGATQVDDTVAGDVATGAVTKIAATWKVNDAQISRDGTHGTRDTTATMPTVTKIAIGASSYGTNQLFGLIYGWTIYDDHYPTDAGMDALTTPTTTRNQSRLTLGLGLGL